MTTDQKNLDELKGQLAILETEREIAQTRVDIDELTKMAEHGRIVMEAFGDWVNPQEYMYDDPSFDLRANPAFPYSRIDDRADGRYRPVFEDETDLALIRGKVHAVTTATATGKNILENLTNYTVGSGFTFEAQAAEGVKEEELPAGLTDAVQKVINTFLDDNDWGSDLERESHWRSREDGETNIALRPRGWRVQASFIEPDQIVGLSNAHDMEAWLANVGAQLGSEVAGDFVHSWSFGVHTRANNTAHHLGYHARFDNAGNDWDYFPADDVPLALRIGSGVMEQIKRNVPANVKRGVSDFYPVVSRIERAEKLGGNVETTAAIQAAIAFIRNHPKTTTQTQISNLQSGNYTSTIQRSSGTGGTRTIKRQKFEPGTIIDTNGSEYHSGPMGQSNAPTFIDVIQSSLRSAGSNWVMPEYMISGDASNNNFASILVAGSPFVCARMGDQRFYKSRYHRMMWKVVRFAYEYGFFKRFNVTWEQLESLIDILVTPPDITIGDDLKNAQIKQIEQQAGVLSKKTWIKESGRDPDEEEKNLAEEGGAPQSNVDQTADGAKTVSLPDAAKSALNGAQIASLVDIVGQVASGAVPLASARPIITAAFPTLPPDVIEQIVTPLQNFKPKVGVDGKPLPDGAGPDGGTGQSAGETNAPATAGEFKDLSRRQWQRNRKAIRDVLKEVAAGEISDTLAAQELSSLGLGEARIQALIADAKDNGKVDDPDFAETQESARDDLPPGMSELLESAYVAQLESATPEERQALLDLAWRGYP